MLICLCYVDVHILMLFQHGIGVVAITKWAILPLTVYLQHIIKVDVVRNTNIEIKPLTNVVTI